MPGPSYPARPPHDKSEDRAFFGSPRTSDTFAEELGEEVVSAAPSGDWSLVTASGTTAPRSDSFGWASRYAVASVSTSTLRFDDGLVPLVAGVFSVVVWILVLAALIDRRRLRREWERVGRPRTWAPARSTARDEIEDVWSMDDGDLG